MRINFNNILLNINIDGAGYKKGKSRFHFTIYPQKWKKVIKDVISNSNGVVEGKQWVQGDHSIYYSILEDQQ
jgi:aminopeptidase YwaD